MVAYGARGPILDSFWDEASALFARRLTSKGDGGLAQDLTVDASAAALFQFGVLPAGHPKVVSTMRAVGEKLWVRAGMGGVVNKAKHAENSASGWLIKAFSKPAM